MHTLTLAALHMYDIQLVWQAIPYQPKGRKNGLAMYDHILYAQFRRILLLIKNKTIQAKEKTTTEREMSLSDVLMLLICPP